MAAAAAARRSDADANRAKLATMLSNASAPPRRRALRVDDADAPVPEVAPALPATDVVPAPSIEAEPVALQQAAAPEPVVSAPAATAARLPAAQPAARANSAPAVSVASSGLRPLTASRAERARVLSAVRPPAAPFSAPDSVKSSVNVAVELLDAIDDWRVARRRDFGHRAAISWLVEAALRDFPTEVDDLRLLADALPEELTRVEPAQQSVVLSRDTVERLRLAADVLRGRRARGIKLWHAVSAALVRQLSAEGIEVV